MPLSLERRAETSGWMRMASPVIAAAATVLVGAALFALLGRDPMLALETFFLRPLATEAGRAELLLKATPLVMCGVGLAIGFRGNVWNIGAEGQFVAGAIAAGGVALAAYGTEGPWLLPLMMLAGTLGGMAWAAIPAFCRTRFGANEILVSLMLSYVALELLRYLVHGPWRDPAGFNFPESRLFGEAALLPVLVEGTRLYASVFAALAAVAAGWVLLRFSFVGFRIKVVGAAPGAAGYAGFRQSSVVWISFLISGGLAGFAGMAEVAGPVGQLNPTFPAGYGFAAIIVAFVGRLHPFGVLLASLLLALTFLGGETLQAELNLPRAVTGLFQGMLLFFVLATEVLVSYRLRFGRTPRRRVQAEPAA